MTIARPIAREIGEQERQANIVNAATEKLYRRRGRRAPGELYGAALLAMRAINRIALGEDANRVLEDLGVTTRLSEAITKAEEE